MPGSPGKMPVSGQPLQVRSGVPLAGDAGDFGAIQWLCPAIGRPETAPGWIGRKDQNAAPVCGP